MATPLKQAASQQLKSKKPLVDIKTKYIRERGRQERASVKAKAVRSQEVIAARRASKVQEAREVAQAKAVVRQQNRAVGTPGPKPYSRAALQGRAETAATNKVISTATPSSDSNLIMTTIFLMAGLIVFYLIVTKAETTASWLNGVSTWLHTLSSNTPLFTTKQG